MWIVRVALNRPYTFVVLALLILLVSPLVILRTPTDIFPNIDIPVLATIWNFTGLSAEEMEGRITTGLERGRGERGAHRYFRSPGSEPSARRVTAVHHYL